MDAERWQQVKDVLNDALERGDAERSAFLDDACGDDAALRSEVDRLLAQDGDEFLQTPAHQAAPVFVHRQVGRYRIIRRIASGGMGTVYEAEQDNPRRTVAIKVMRAGLATAAMMRRFELEAQVLGRLSHPGIAQIFEAGAFDDGEPCPYFAMELVDGVPLTEHVESRSLDHREQLELIATICDALEHAHQRGVIHRDLKPSNILVEASGRPRIVDFGVARAVDGDVHATMLTATGALVGTLQYMSPEQFAGDVSAIDARSDIYAVGVLCYELLAGRPPHECDTGSVVEMSRLVTTVEPAPLRVVDRRFRGDVETIVGRALEKDPDQRYASVADLAADIRRYLNHEPIIARPPSTLYQLRKLAGRHRALVGGIAATFLALLAGLVLFVLEARRANVEAHKAQYEAEKYRAVNDFVVNDLLWEILSDVGGDVPDHEQRIAARVATAAAVVEQRFADEPLHAAAIRNQLATLAYNLGDYEQAETLFRSCAATRRSLLGPEHPDTLNATNNVGLALMSRGAADEAESWYRTALEGRRRVLGAEHADTLVSMNNLAALLVSRGDLDEAGAMLTEAIAIQRRVRGPRHSDTLVSMSTLSGVLSRRGDQEGAERLQREALEGFEATLGPDHLTTLVAMSRLARLRLRLDRPEEARALFAAATEGFSTALGPDHLHTLATSAGLADAMIAQQQFDQAEPVARQVAAGFTTLFGPSHARTRGSARRLVTIYEGLGRTDEAAVWRERSAAP